MELFWLTGLFIFISVFALDRKVIAFNLQFYLRGLKIITIAVTAGILIRLLLGVIPPAPEATFGHLFAVGWEDMVFSVVPIYYARKFLHHKLALVSTILASLLFAAGHIYISYDWAAITTLYPFFISYKIGRKYGYGTSIALHVTYDLAVTSAPIILTQLAKYV
jgi:hypothetical protein